MTRRPRSPGMRRNVCGQIHSVMKNANHFDRVVGRCSIHDEMPPTPPPAGYMETAQAIPQHVVRRLIASAPHKLFDQRGLPVGQIDGMGRRHVTASSFRYPAIIGGE